ncbi:MAG: SpoIIE family protein phosphatase [Ignavibacteriae bacterium]|nr:SpoIIE family protein phosphatase [Ignavibacteriota bacterium]
MQNIFAQPYLWNTVLGVIVSGVGFAVLVLSLFRLKQKDISLTAFGATSLLYGLRLLIETQLSQYVSLEPPAGLLYLNAFCTYLIPIPLSGFLSQLFGKGWRNSGLWVFRAATLFAFAGIVSDAIRTTPLSLERLNNILVILWAFVIFKNASWSGIQKTRETRVVLIGFIMFGLFAVNDNLVALNLLPWDWGEEAIGFLLFLISLGYAVAYRFFNNEKQLLSVRQEMETARQIQFSILPTRMPDIDGVEISARYIPMTAVAGDFYDIVHLGKKQICVLVADVSGHGVGAALIASMIKVAFASQTQNMSNPAEVMKAMNTILCDKLESKFITAGCVFIDAENGTLRYAGAGHPPLLIWRKSEQRMVELCENGPLIGPFPDATYSNTNMNLESGDRIILYTDGIIETTNESGSFFGDDSFTRFIQSHENVPAEQFTEMLLKHLAAWSGKRADESLDDDLTLIVVDRS